MPLQHWAMNATVYEVMRADSLQRLLVQSGSAVFMLITGLIGGIANAILIYVIVVRKQLHTHCWTIICQLAVADLIVCVSFALLVGLKRLIRLALEIDEVKPVGYCTIEFFLPYFAQGASLTLAISIAVERLVATATPLYYQSSMTRYSIAACHYAHHYSKRTVLLSAISWAFAVCDSVPMFYGVSWTKNIPNCLTVTAMTKEFFNFQAYERTGLVGMITVLYSILLIVVLYHARKIRKIGHQQPSGKTTQNATASQRRYQRDLRVSRMLVVIGLCYLVFQIIGRLGLAILPTAIRQNIGPYFRSLMIVNSAVNFFIYFSMSAEFKRETLTVMGCMQVMQTITTAHGHTTKNNQSRK